MTTTNGTGPGRIVRGWRTRRRMSQLDLALAAGVSARHLSFVETGRSNASRELLLALAEELEVPMRERNGLLLAGGFAPAYAESDLDDPALAPVRAALEELLRLQEPNPALVTDRYGTLRMANRAVGALITDVDPALLTPPVNLYRLSLHPDGLAQHVVNLGQWAEHLIQRLARLARATADPEVTGLLGEVRRYPVPRGTRSSAADDVLLPLRLRHPAGELRLHSTLTTFGAPHDVTLSELALESFFPADETTRRILQELCPPEPAADTP